MLRDLPAKNIVIFVIWQRPPQALATFNLHAGRMAISAITLGELDARHGEEQSSGGQPGRPRTLPSPPCSPAS